MKTINKQWEEGLVLFRKPKTTTQKSVVISLFFFLSLAGVIACSNSKQKSIVFESCEFVIEVPEDLYFIKLGDKWNAGCFKYIVANCPKDTLVNYFGLTINDVLKTNVRWIEFECSSPNDVGMRNTNLSELDTAYLEMYWLNNGAMGISKVQKLPSSGDFLFSIENSRTLIRNYTSCTLFLHSLDSNLLKRFEGSNLRIAE